MPTSLTIRTALPSDAEAVTAYDHAIQKIHTPGASDWVVFYDRGIAYERSSQWPKDLCPSIPGRCRRDSTHHAR